MALTPEHAIDMVNEVYGRHAGFRALHAKGVLLRGTFTAAPEAAALSRAAHLQGDPIPATVRFSNGSGNPDHADWLPDLRGLAVKMYLPDDSRTDIVAVSSPRFLTPTPEGFVELLELQTAGPAGALKLPGFFARHRTALGTIPSTLAAMRPPSSYAVISYYGVHAFKFLDANGGERYVRYTLRPDAGGSWLPPLPAGHDYLQDEIRERVARGPVSFTLELQVATPGDPVDDPSAAWPSGRRRVDAGQLVINGRETERETGGDVLVFDPTRVTDGIELSADPVLRFRREAYSESIARRTGGQA
jgi:catalase